MGRQRTSRLAALGLVSLGLIAAVGCTDPLFSPNEPRTQYDRYDRVRGQFVAQEVEDEYGQKHPNLAGRLGRDN